MTADIASRCCSGSDRDFRGCTAAFPSRWIARAFRNTDRPTRALNEGSCSIESSLVEEGSVSDASEYIHVTADSNANRA